MLLLAEMTPNGWRPGIGDPTVMGWVTVACYFLAAVACWFARRAVPMTRRARSTDRRERRKSSSRSTRRMWLILTVLFVLLGINKQLDLQTFFTDVGRYFAQSEGWYKERRGVQAVFIGLVTLAGLGTISYFAWLSKRSWREHGVALVGVAFLMTFIVVRAASFHHVEDMLRFELWGARMNWILELGGIACVGLAALYNAIHPPRVAREKARANLRSRQEEGLKRLMSHMQSEAGVSPMRPPVEVVEVRRVAPREDLPPHPQHG